MNKNKKFHVERTELFYAIIPTLFLCFLLICYPYNLLVRDYMLAYIPVCLVRFMSQKSLHF